MMLFLNWVLRCQSLQSVLVFNFTNMHAISSWSDYHPWSCRVNISEPAFSVTVSLFSAVSQVGIPSFLISTVMSDTKPLNTLLLKVMISCKNKLVFSSDWSDPTLQIILDAWWALMNIVSKRPIAWNNSRLVPSLRFYLHCTIEETGSPSIICIICHHNLCHPSEHDTSSMGKHLLAEAYIAK
jgi:hypothetical protein